MDEANTKTRDPELPEDESRSPSSYTLKAFLIGAFFSFFLSIGGPYGNMAIRGSYMALDFSTPGALFLFFFLVGVLNVVLKLTGRALLPSLLFLAVVAIPCVRKVTDPSFQFELASPGIIFSIFILLLASVNVIVASLGKSLSLNRGELLVVYVMMIVASAIPTMGISEYLLPIITAVFYYASPENGWKDLIHPHIPDWIAPRDPHVIEYFYEGLPEGVEIPWSDWIVPLIYWIAFLFALYFVMICTMVIVRGQWIERERLIYPLVQVPLEMVRNESGSLLNPFFKSPAMWAGFSIPTIISTLNALHRYYSFLPGVSTSTSISLFRRTISLPFNLSFPMIGFSYLINLDIAFSLWFFNILSNIEKGIFRVTGVHSTENLGIYGAGRETPILAHQGMGAMIVLVISGLWIGREHLKNVFSKAFGRGKDIDDSGEMLSYRSAVFGTIGGLAFMTFWLNASGLPLWIAILFLFGAFLIFLGLTRIVVESGVAEAVASTISSSFVVSGVGSSALGPVGMTALAFTYTWSADIRTFVMASSANGLKLAEEIGKNKKPLFWAMMLSIVVSLLGSIWMILELSYSEGGVNLNRWFFGAGAREPFNYIQSYLDTPTTPNWGGWIHTGIGSFIMGLLMMARRRFLALPFHPIGYPIGAVWLMDHIWFSIFLAWLLKAVILKYGGIRWFRGTRPFFLGLILGQFVIAGIWLIIDYFTGMTGNQVFWI